MDQTDLEKWKDFLNTYNILYDTTESKNKTIVLETDNGIGYSGFYLEVLFNLDGSFLSYGVWE